MIIIIYNLLPISFKGVISLTNVYILGTVQLHNLLPLVRACENLQLYVPVSFNWLIDWS